jgi:diguanylate cyclase (GGDEF)-like protein
MDTRLRGQIRSILISRQEFYWRRPRIKPLMQLPNDLGADDLGNSVYARALRSNSVRSRFSPDLEHQFLAKHLQRVRLRVRVWFSLNLILALMTTVLSLRQGSGGATFWLLVASLLPCAVVPAWLAWGKLYGRYYLSAAVVFVPLIGLLNAIFVAQTIASNEGAIASLTVGVIAAFFFSGLLFREALFSALVIPVAFAISSLYFDATPIAILRCLLVLAVTCGVAAIIYRDIELAYRKSFLEAGLISELAAHDSLTGLMNRRAFDKHLLRVWQQAQRDRRTLTILLIDIDHFKAYNDSYGHQAGDVALRSVAQLLNAFARRPLDLAARYGGEEFAIILYDLAAPHVRDIAERVRLAVQNAPPLNLGPITSAVTVSIGVGTVTPGVGRTPAGALQLADRALYEAKRRGRNAIAVAGSDDYESLETGSFNTARKR